MPTIYQDLKLENDPSTIVRPNIEGPNIPTSAVDSSKIATEAVTTEKIAALAVTREKIANASIDASKLATQSVTGDKMAPNAVDGQTIQTDAIESFHINARAVTLAKMNFVTATLSNSIGSVDFQALYDLFVEIVRNPAYAKIYFADSGEYSPLQITIIDTSRIVFNFKGSSATIGSDSDATNFINDYGAYIFITRLA